MMETPNLPQTATKVWVPLLVAGGPMLAAITGITWLKLTPEDALNVVIVGWLLSQLVNSAVSWLTKNFLKRPVEIITPGMQPNITVTAGTPWWHSTVRYAALVVLAGIVGVLAYWIWAIT